mmetsp:Transcript_28381/g.88262  ORF Transcript_28381/g.88262 Transcript_28381/m.88262 type:complete len:229 (-) Transcript_28381:154-840(-)
MRSGLCAGVRASLLVGVVALLGLLHTVFCMDHAASQNVTVGSKQGGVNASKPWTGRDVHLVDELMEQLQMMDTSSQEVEESTHNSICAELPRIVKSSGFSVTRSDRTGGACVLGYSVVADLKAVLSFEQKEERLRLRYGVKVPGISQWNTARSLIFANKWNTWKSYTKVFVDKDGDLALEMELHNHMLKSIHRSLPVALGIFKVSVRAFTAELLLEASRLARAGGAEL